MDGRFFQPSPAGARGLLLYSLGRYSAAAKAYRAHFREAGWDPILRGDLRAAEAQAEPALRQNPADTEALLRRGEIALERGRLDEALRAFQQVVRLDSDHLDAHLLSAEGERPWCLLAHLYRYLRVFDDSNARLAIAAARRTIAAGDRPADAYLTLGIIAYWHDEPEQALGAFLRATDADPRHAEARR